MSSVISYQETHYIQTTYTTLYLQSNKKAELKIYYCSTCRCPLLQFKGDLVQELPGLTEAKLPMIIQCRNPQCGRKFMVTAIVKKDEV